MGIADYENYDALGLAKLVRDGDAKPEELPRSRRYET